MCSDIWDANGTGYNKKHWKLEYFTCSPALTETGVRRENKVSQEKRPAAPLISHA
jgi:hypothetical protein